MNCNKINSHNNFKAKMNINGFCGPRSAEGKKWKNIAELFEYESTLYPYDTLEVTKTKPNYFKGKYLIDNKVYEFELSNCWVKAKDAKQIFEQSDIKIAKAFSRMLELIKKQIFIKSQSQTHINEILKKFPRSQHDMILEYIVTGINAALRNDMRSKMEANDILKYISFFGERK